MIKKLLGRSLSSNLQNFTKAISEPKTLTISYLFNIMNSSPNF